MIANLLLLCIAFTLAFGVRPYKPFSDYNKDALSSEFSNKIKGIFCVIIVLTHFSACRNDVLLLKPFNYMGFLGVSGFFFISGYGVFISYLNKTNYIKGFLKKRYTKLLIPWIIAFIAYEVYFTLNGTPFSLDQLISNIKNGNTFVRNAWYVVVIAIFYFAFYITAKTIKPKSMCAATLIIIIFIIGIIMAFCGYHEYWYSSLAALCVGIIWGVRSEQITFYFKCRYWVKTLCLCFVFAVGLFVRLVLKNLLPSEPALTIAKAVIDEIITAALAFVIPVLSMKFISKNRLVDWLGKISYEIYLMHGLFIALFNDSFPIKNSALFMVAVFACTLPSAVAINYLSKTITDKIIKKKDFV